MTGVSITQWLSNLATVVIEMEMPILFVGHGSPMNAIEENQITKKWRELGAKLPKPRAIVVISAHWYTKQTAVNNQLHPRQVYDMYGFPDELYALKYDVQGSPSLALEIQQRLAAFTDTSWGIDHGTWSVLTHMYPDATIPTLQVSINRQLDLQASFALGQQLRALRDEQVLLIGSGNIVHHLGRVDWEQPNSGYPEAVAFDQAIQAATQQQNYAKIFQLAKVAFEQKRVFATWEHFLPFIYLLGATTPTDHVEVFNQEYQYGSISMTSYLWQS